MRGEQGAGQGVGGGGVSVAGWRGGGGGKGGLFARRAPGALLFY